MWLQKQARSGRTKSLKKDLSLYPEVHGDSTGLQRVCDTRLKITHVIIQIAFGSSTVGTPPQGKRKKKKHLWDKHRGTTMHLKETALKHRVSHLKERCWMKYSFSKPWTGQPSVNQIIRIMSRGQESSVSSTTTSKEQYGPGMPAQAGESPTKLGNPPPTYRFHSIIQYPHISPLFGLSVSQARFYRLEPCSVHFYNLNI